MHVVFAYIDPGTGSYLLQVALGGLFAAGYAVRHFWARITGAFRGTSAPGTPDANDVR